MEHFSLTRTTFWRHAREVARKLAEDHCSLIAAAMSFFALLSMVPLILLAVGILGSVLTSARAQEVVLDFVREQLPTLQTPIGDELRRLVQTYRWSGWVGLLGLLWASSQVFLNVELALNLAWHVHRHRSLLQRRVLSLAMALLAGVPLGLSLLLTVAITAVRRWTIPLLGWKLEQIPWVWSLAAELVPVVLTVGSLTALYRWVPNGPVRWRSAVIGGVTGGVLWEIAKRVFAYYTATLAQFGRIYGPFAGLVGLMLWIYYSALIVLLGAEVAAVAQSIHPILPEARSEEADERLREADATGV